MILKAVSKISNCQGDITSGWGIKQLGIPLILFASIFYESCQGTQSCEKKPAAGENCYLLG